MVLPPTARLQHWQYVTQNSCASDTSNIDLFDWTNKMYLGKRNIIIAIAEGLRKWTAPFKCRALK
eukprot:9439166-Karenia_brevis.AAC.1